MNKFLYLLLILLACNVAQAQMQYKYKTPEEIAWVGGGGAGLGVYLLLNHHNKAFTPEEITALNPNQIWKIDRFSTRHYSASARKASDVLVTASYSLPALLYLDPKIRNEAPGYLLIQAEAALSTLALTSVVKATVRRPRPFNYNPDAPLSEKLKKDARQSFFSGHTSMTTCMTFSSAKIWCDHHPDSRLKPLIWTGAVAYPLTVAFLRMKGGKHFLTDVGAGFVIGAAVGLLVPELHRRKSR